jgi:hypothetical protein
LDKIIYTSKFPPFADTYEAVKNIIPLKKLKRKKGVAHLYLINLFNNSFFNQDPLLMVNNQIVQSFNIIAALDYEQIERFEVYYNSNKNLRRFGEIGIYGIFRVVTVQEKSGLTQSYEVQGFSLN